VTSQEDVARAALADISPAGTVGALLERIDGEDGTATLRFLSTLSGYPGWYWSVSVAEVPGEEPTVMEAELMPGDGALLAPDWVPWAERLEDYRAAQALIAAEGASDDFEDVDDDELAVPLRGIDEQDEAEAESDDDRPEQPDEI
jgi:hypothetical protein